MFKTLLAKLTLALLLIFIVLGMFGVSLTLMTAHLYRQEVMQKLNHEVAAHIVQETDLMQGDRVNQTALRQLFHSLMVLNPSLEIYLLDHTGGILAFSAPPWKVVRLSVDVEPIKRYLAGDAIMPLVGDDPREMGRSKVFSAATVPFANQPDGYLYVILGGEDYDSISARIEASYILKSSLWLIAIGLSITFVSGLLLFMLLTRRLKTLARAMVDFENDPDSVPSFPYRVNEGDEIDRLGSIFRSMASKINQQLGELQTTDHLRRELVANVSHDLRTPLATLQGYIETLLIKQADLSIDQQQSYLRNAVSHCDRLNKLVSELFELAKLDASETKPQREVFNLAELAEDVIQKFSLIARQKNIRLQARYDAAESFVFADIHLIERVLENLLENALRFVADEGLITISLNADREQMRIEVSDNGCGIPPTELPYIFDRFYQLDNNRNVEKGNSGLGLAIVKRIIELHQSIISVRSIPGRETTFSFTLPASPH